jgi:hypothetical protein
MRAFTLVFAGVAAAVAAVIDDAVIDGDLSKVRGDAHPSRLLPWRSRSSRRRIRRRFRPCSPARRSLPGSREV